MALATQAALPNYPHAYTNAITAALLAYGTPGADAAVGAARVAAELRRWDADADGPPLFGWVLEEQAGGPGTLRPGRWLRGRDRAVMDVLARAQRLTHFEVHLAVVEHRRVGPLSGAGKWEQDGELTAVERWADARLPPVSVHRTAQLYPPDPFEEATKEAESIISRDTLGALRSEDRFHLSAIMLWPPSQTFDIVSADGASIAIDYFDRAAANGEQERRQFADRLFAFLGEPGEIARLTARAATRLVVVLTAHKEEALLLRFLRAHGARYVADLEFRAAIPPALRSLSAWEAATPVLTRLYSHLAKYEPCQALAFFLALAPSGACTAPLPPLRVAFYAELAAAVVGTVNSLHGRGVGVPELRRLLDALSTLDRDDLMELVTAGAISNSPHLIQDLLRELPPSLHSSSAYAMFLGAAIKRAERHVADTVPAPMPANFAVEAALQCTLPACTDCPVLLAFLHSATEEELVVDTVDVRRHTHLTKVINEHGLYASVAGQTVYHATEVERFGAWSLPKTLHYRIWKKARELHAKATETHAQAIAKLHALVGVQQRITGSGGTKREREPEGGAEMTEERFECFAKKQPRRESPLRASG